MENLISLPNHGIVYWHVILLKSVK